MNEKIDEVKIKNIITFLLIIFNNNDEIIKEIMNINPEYLIEKFDRYILSEKSESEWGMHPSIRNTLFDRYCKKYGIKNNGI